MFKRDFIKQKLTRIIFKMIKDKCNFFAKMHCLIVIKIMEKETENIKDYQLN